MKSKKYIFIVLGICLLVFAGCSNTDKTPPSSGSNSISEEISYSEPQPALEGSIPEQPTPEAPVPDSSSSKESEAQQPEHESNAPSQSNDDSEPSKVILDFTKISANELKSILKPILDKAAYFCDFGNVGEIKGVDADFSEDATIERPYRNSDNHTYYPYTNLPYKTVEELKQDMRTVFTPDVLERELLYIFNSIIDDDGKIYFASDVTGYSKETFWDLDSLEIVDAKQTAATVSMSVLEPRENVTFTALLNLKIENKNIVMDGSYFAKKNS